MPGYSTTSSENNALSVTTTAKNGHQTPPKSTSTMEPNVREVILGDLPIKAWYPSFYSEDLVGRSVDRLFVCQWCFKYTKDAAAFLGHTKACEYREPKSIGTLIYEKDEISIHEIDGEQFKLYTQNLSLFAKLFLDTKSVFYDVTTFLYYMLVYTDKTEKPLTPHVIGFFSKEKLSWDSNNLACILVFPPWQKRGFGQILMGASYELSKWDGRLGGPEKPLSELGRRAYTNFWAATIARYIVKLPTKKTITVKAISEATYIIPDDIIATLKEMQVLEHRKKGDAEAVINKAQIKAWAAANRVDMAGPVDENAFVNRPDEQDEEEEEMEE